MMRNVLRHVSGIASVCSTTALLYAAYLLQEHAWAFLQTVAAFAPGYFALRYLREVTGWRSRR